MSHNRTDIIVDSIFHIFDPNDPEYEGVRDHFSTTELSKIDEIRAFHDTHNYTGAEKAFVIYAVSKALFTADD